MTHLPHEKIIYRIESNYRAISPNRSILYRTVDPISPETILKNFLNKSIALIDDQLMQVKNKYPKLFI